MDPQGRSSVSNAPTFAANCQLQDLGIWFLFVACWLEFEGDFPLFGEGGEGCQKAVPLQQVFTWKREWSCPIEKATLTLSILKEERLWELNWKDKLTYQYFCSQSRVFLIYSFRKIPPAGTQSIEVSLISIFKFLREPFWLEDQGFPAYTFTSDSSMGFVFGFVNTSSFPMVMLNMCCWDDTRSCLTSILVQAPTEGRGLTNLL